MGRYRAVPKVPYNNGSVLHIPVHVVRTLTFSITAPRSFPKCWIPQDSVAPMSLRVPQCWQTAKSRIPAPVQCFRQTGVIAIAGGTRSDLCEGLRLPAVDLPSPY